MSHARGVYGAGGERLTNEIADPLQRTPFIDLANGAMSLARRTGLARAPLLELPALLEEAHTATGLSDFGDRWFETPFAVLLDALHREARLNPSGEWAAHGQFHKVLKDRLWAERWFASHPEILARPLPRPVIVMGPMRSGTTRVHRLLASDHRFNNLRSFETISPVPRPEFEHGKPDFRVTLAERIMRVARLANPRTLSIHPTGPLEAEEELGLLVSSFWGMKHEAQWWVPSYARWCEAADATPAYRQMARLLKLIGWSQQASSLRPFVLKTPQHMLDLPALLAVFPDARLIFTHRDPQAVVGSAASLAWNQTIIYSDHVRPEQIGAEWLRKTRLMIERMIRARAGIAPHRAIDVQYEEMERDWRGAMARLYDFLGLDIGPALPGMEAYQRRVAALKRRPHCYSLEQFGLRPGRVAAELREYIERYNVPLETDVAVTG
jgi:hypothetical protein